MHDHVTCPAGRSPGLLKSAAAAWAAVRRAALSRPRGRPAPCLPDEMSSGSDGRWQSVAEGACVPLGVAGYAPARADSRVRHGGDGARIALGLEPLGCLVPVACRQRPPARRAPRRSPCTRAARAGLGTEGLQGRTSRERRCSPSGRDSYSRN